MRRKSTTSAFEADTNHRTYHGIVGFVDRIAMISTSKKTMDIAGWATALGPEEGRTAEGLLAIQSSTVEEQREQARDEANAQVKTLRHCCC